MSLQDDVFDVQADIREFCSNDAVEAFDSIVTRLWEYEAELDELQKREAKIKAGFMALREFLP